VRWWIVPRPDRSHFRFDAAFEVDVDCCAPDPSLMEPRCENVTLSLP